MVRKEPDSKVNSPLCHTGLQRHDAAIEAAWLVVTDGVFAYPAARRRPAGHLPSLGKRNRSRWVR